MAVLSLLLPILKRLNCNMVKEKKIKYLFFIILFILLDQRSKTFFITYLKTIPGYNFEIFPFLDVVYSWNYGISFGLFREYYQYSNYAFMAINSLIRGIFTSMFKTVTWVLLWSLNRLNRILIILHAKVLFFIGKHKMD